MNVFRILVFQYDLTELFDCNNLNNHTKSWLFIRLMHFFLCYPERCIQYSYIVNTVQTSKYPKRHIHNVTLYYIVYKHCRNIFWNMFETYCLRRKGTEKKQIRVVIYCEYQYRRIIQILRYKINGDYTRRALVEVSALFL